MERNTDRVEADGESGFDIRRGLKAGALRLAKTGFALADGVMPAWPGPRVLIYHQVGSGMRGQMDVDLSVFERQIAWLEERGRFARLENTRDETAAPDADRVWVLTFDDGYRDVYDNAFPILKERGVPFTLYLTTAPMERRERYDNGGRPLDWDQVGEMVATGLVTLGAHTHTHPDLRYLSRSRIGEELDESNRVIESRTGIFPDHFCYPKGYWSAAAEEEIRSRYRTATLGAGDPVTSNTDPFRIHRVPVQRSDGLVFFKRKLKTGMRLEEKIRRALKRYESPPQVFG